MLIVRFFGIGLALMTSIGAAQAVGTVLALTAGTTGDGDYYSANTPAIAATGSVLATSAFGSADVTVDLGMGEIHASTHATITQGVAQFSRTITVAKAIDEITAHAAFEGTPVRVRWSLPISGSSGTTGNNVLDATFTFFTQSNFDNQGLTYRRQIVDNITTYDGYYGDRATVDVTYLAGQRYVSSVELYSTVDVVGSNVASSGYFDFSNTAHAYAQVLTPGATLTSVSGHDYAAPVPEPTTLAALGLGALGLLRRRRAA